MTRVRGRGEGQPRTPAQASAPHPNPLPMRRAWGEGTGTRRRFERSTFRCDHANHGAQGPIVHHRHRGGVPARRPGEPGPRARDAARRCSRRRSRRCSGQVAREFLKSQIEVGTGVHTTPREAGVELASLRQTVAKLAGEHGLAPIAASTHPFARWSTQQPTERERYQAIAQRPRRRRPAPRHLRHARARRHRGRRAAHRPDEPGALFPAAPARAVHLLAVRRRRGHRPQVLPARRLPGAAAHGPARPLRELGGIPPDRRPAGAQRHHRGRQQDLVGPAPLVTLPDAGDAHHRRVHAARGRRVRGGDVS